MEVDEIVVILSDNLIIVTLETHFDLSISDKTYTNQHDALWLNSLGGLGVYDTLKKYRYIKIFSTQVNAYCLCNIIDASPYGSGKILHLQAFIYAYARKWDIAIFPPNMNNSSFRVRIYNL